MGFRLHRISATSLIDIYSSHTVNGKLSDSSTVTVRSCVDASLLSQTRRFKM